MSTGTLGLKISHFYMKTVPVLLNWDRQLKNIKRGEQLLLLAYFDNFDISYNLSPKLLGKDENSKSRVTWLSFAQFVYFLRGVCLLFNKMSQKCREVKKLTLTPALPSDFPPIPISVVRVSTVFDKRFLIFKLFCILIFKTVLGQSLPWGFGQS